MDSERGQHDQQRDLSLYQQEISWDTCGYYRN
jgi:hypothetical protein